ncbi:hypothetical protein FRC02_011912, partial [Tulasnella sp. 418]
CELTSSANIIRASGLVKCHDKQREGSFSALPILEEPKYPQAHEQRVTFLPHANLATVYGVMWLFRRRSVSPNFENNDPTNKIQEAQVKLLTAKDELVDLPIPKLKETFVMIYDLLELCKKSKGDPAPINAFIELLTRLIDGVHDFITKSKRRGEADMAKSPADSIEALITELFHLFSARQQLSASSTDRIDLSSNLATLNPDISAAIHKFMNKESNHDRAEQVRAWVLDMSRIDQSTGESIDVGKVIKQGQHPLTIPRNTNPEQVFPELRITTNFVSYYWEKCGQVVVNPEYIRSTANGCGPSQNRIM